MYTRRPHSPQTFFLPFVFTLALCISFLPMTIITSLATLSPSAPPDVLMLSASGLTHGGLAARCWGGSGWGGGGCGVVRPNLTGLCSYFQCVFTDSSSYACSQIHFIRTCSLCLHRRTAQSRIYRLWRILLGEKANRLFFFHLSLLPSPQAHRLCAILQKQKAPHHQIITCHLGAYQLQIRDYGPTSHNIHLPLALHMLRLFPALIPSGIADTKPRVSAALLLNGQEAKLYSFYELLLWLPPLQTGEWRQSQAHNK